ncbi:Exocyst complex component SEC3A-like protein [Drosera capensis]
MIRAQKMAKPIAAYDADAEELRRACEAAIGGTDETIKMAFRVSKSHGLWGTSKWSGFSRPIAKPRVLVITANEKGKRCKGFLHVLRYSNELILEAAKLYKLNHLSTVAIVNHDPSGCTFTMGFDNIGSKTMALLQWTVHKIDDRNRFLLCIFDVCKDIRGHIPKVNGIDVVEMALWAKENKTSVDIDRANHPDGLLNMAAEKDLKVTVEKELVLQAVEDDMDALLGNYVLGIGETEAFCQRLKRELLALEAANVHAILETKPLVEEVSQGIDSALNSVEDMTEWLGTCNLKLKYMKEDIQLIETQDKELIIQCKNDASLIEELDRFLARLRVPSEYVKFLSTALFDEGNMAKNIEACKWLNSALRGLQAPSLDAVYENMRAVKEKKEELENLKSRFVRRASDFLGNYFTSLVDFMISDTSYFSQSLDDTCLVSLRKAYCRSLNLLLQREAQEFSNELRVSTKAVSHLEVWPEASATFGQTASTADTSAVSEAYLKMLTVFVPLLVDESSFFANFMCFEVPALSSLGSVANGNLSTSHGEEANYDDLGIMDIDNGDQEAELATLNECWKELLDGVQEYFYAVVDWAYKIDPLRCISLNGVTERYLSSQKADASGSVRLLLADLNSRISMLFNRFVEEACRQIGRNERNVQHLGVVPYIPRFATLAAQMERCVQGQSRDLVDQAYTKFVSVMFAILEKIAATDRKHGDIYLLENYAAFQSSLYVLATSVPTLAKSYQHASEAYEQASVRYINSIIENQFEKLIQLIIQVERHAIPLEDIAHQNGVPHMELRKMVRSTLTAVNKSVASMHKRLQKDLTSDELLPSLWAKCKIEFLAKYKRFANIVATVYPTETIISVEDMKELLASIKS